MKLKYKYTIFIVILHTILVIVLYQLLKENKWYFLASEILVILSLVLSYSLYKQLIKPLSLMQSGVDALVDNDFNIRFVNTGSKEMDKLISVYNTMIDRLSVERVSTEEQSYFLQKLFDNSPLGMIILDYNNRLTDVNEMARDYLKLGPDFKGKTLDEINSPLLNPFVDIPVDEQKMVEVNGINKFKVLVNHVIHKGFARKFIIIEELTKEILETEKKAYGKVIRMMAHEVNNSMGAVNSILNTVHEYGFEDGQNQDLKTSLEIAIDRNKNLGFFMDNFAEVIRLPEPNKSLENLPDLLRKVGQLYEQRALTKKIKITYVLDDIVKVNIDALQIEQVITNIIKNAIESIGQDGHIIISSTQKGFIIQDNGPGITSKNARRLFTPFFSTKTNGQGIGLIICRDILKNHGATFDLITDNRTNLTNFSVQF